MPATYEIYKPNEKPRWPEVQKIQMIDNQIVAVYRDSNDASVADGFLRSHNFSKKGIDKKSFFRKENTITFDVNLCLSVEKIKMFVDPYWNRIIPIRKLSFEFSPEAKKYCRILKRNFERECESMVVFLKGKDVILGFPKNFHCVNDEILLLIKKTPVVDLIYSFKILDSQVMMDFENRVNQKQSEDETVIVDSGFCGPKKEEESNHFEEDNKISLDEKNFEEISYDKNNSFSCLFSQQVTGLIYGGSRVFLPEDFEQSTFEDLSQKEFKR